MLNTFEAKVFTMWGEQHTCFVKTTDEEIDKLREYLVLIPNLKIQEHMIGANLLDPELIYSEVMPHQESSTWLPYADITSSLPQKKR